RDHYQLIRMASGAALVVLGLLLFFHRDAWLRVGVNRALELVGVGTFDTSAAPPTDLPDRGSGQGPAPAVRAGSPCQARGQWPDEPGVVRSRRHVGISGLELSPRRARRKSRSHDEPRGSKGRGLVPGTRTMAPLATSEGLDPRGRKLQRAGAHPP